MRIVLKEAPKISPINQTAIDQLKKLLSMAESGELQSIAYVGEMLCGDIFMIQRFDSPMKTGESRSFFVILLHRVSKPPIHLENNMEPFQRGWWKSSVSS